MKFYDCKWSFRTEKHEIPEQLASVTLIGIGVLEDPQCLSTIPVGRRTSWAAKRETTRIEDTAYCLMGIFDVNLPMIYGEGEKAFLRLQEAIAMSNNDLYLFAWMANPNLYGQWHGAFATHPSQFVSCNNLETRQDLFRSHSFSVTNQGIEFQTYLELDEQKGDYLVPLQCTLDGQHEAHEVAIRLIKTARGYVRHEAHEKAIVRRLFRRPGDVSGRLAICVQKAVDSIRHDTIADRFEHSFQFTTRITQDSTHEEDRWYHEFRAIHPTRGKLNSWDVDCNHGLPAYWDPSTASFMTEGKPWFIGLLFVQLRRHRGDHPSAISLLCRFYSATNQWLPVGSLGSSMAPPSMDHNWFKQFIRYVSDPEQGQP